jgi:hypothetical protein
MIDNEVRRQRLPQLMRPDRERADAMAEAEAKDLIFGGQHRGLSVNPLGTFSDFNSTINLHKYASLMA